MNKPPLPNSNLEPILDELRRERAAQDRKFGDQGHKGIAEWHAILAEEAGEVSKEVCEVLHGDTSTERMLALRAELVQTAAVALAWLEYGDASNWWNNVPREFQQR